MKTMTYEKFDDLCEKVTNYKYKPDGWYPTLEEINKYIKPEPQKYISFILWILENNELPKTKEDKEIVRELNEILKKNIIFKEK